ncbi:hypothetical protein CBR_g45401 [Chara braunii]|uniref:Core Histone H2A/H2B/H3 domain-containing protein n=1 Tax=Chara braunii TaxID=69332 RepID=A0A388LYK4_CHABU|nr:hypothetical protein CBR_g45401 [Chara braunii]|eukprot:GBG87341.1 hypothetical protein CBR_g45401 [Chara braunii]
MATLPEIRKLQRSTDLCLAFKPFLRLVREVVEHDIAPGMGVRFQMTAVRALMEAAEAYLVANFENTNEVVIHSKRVTIQKMDSGPRVCDCGRPFMSLRTLNSHRARACPAVADERTHGEEMGVIDDVGPSSIGALNLVSDESEDIGAPENVDGEGGTFEEQQPQPVESFDSSRKLAALIFSARGGVGMSQSDIDALLSLLTDPRSSTRDIAYRNSRECLTWVGSLAEAAGWKELDLRCDDWPRDAHAILWHRDWQTTFLSIFHIALQKCETVSSLEVSPPGVENRPPKAPDKRSREDGMSKVHRRTKKRITYKNDRMVEMIDLRASDDMQSAAREEAEEEHDQSISEKSDGEENEATSDEEGDSETSDGHSRDTHDVDDEDGRSSDGTAQDEGGDRGGEDDRSADGRGSSPSPERTRRTREPESGGEGGATDAPSIDRQLVRHDNAVKKGKQNVLQLVLLHNDYLVTAQSDDISLMRGCRCDERTVETGCRISQITKTSRAAEQIGKLVFIKQDIASSVCNRYTVMSFSVFKLDRAVSVAEKAAALFRAGVPSVHRSGSYNPTITDDDFDLEFIALLHERSKDVERDTESLCARH